ncbi:DUF1284 domain-containing protein [Dongia sp.]|uniref:DUF1284 domain-containing protein n=1 Tax=Dongia sp. TaxID=1977262 RepID=UPI0035ADB0DB
MTVRLRAHHLLCMLTYVGKGYSTAFTENFDRICERLGRGEDIELVDGPDDVCAPLLADEEPHCHNESVLVRDAEALAAISRQFDRPLASGARVTLNPPLLAEWRAAFRDGATRAACHSCEWHDLCTEIANNEFPEIRLRAG